MDKETWPVWRSLLFVPADNERFLSKAADRGADALLLDLEDSIPPDRKDAARTRAISAIEELARCASDILVRINQPLRLAVPDLEAVVRPGVRALLLPKCESAGQVQMLSEAVASLEAERGLPVGGIRFCLLLESAAAYGRAGEIAASDPRNLSLSLGSEDFSTDLDMHPDAETLFVPKQQILIAAVAAGLMPLGLFGTVADYQDLDAIEATARRSAKFGFQGATCIHPGVVAALNKGFSPEPEEVARARGIVDVLARAEAQGLGAVSYEGKMVDAPVADRARRLVQRAEAIARRG